MNSFCLNINGHGQNINQKFRKTETDPELDQQSTEGWLAVVSVTNIVGVLR